MITMFNLLIASEMFNDEDDASQALCNIKMEPVYADFDFHYEHEFVDEDEHGFNYKIDVDTETVEDAEEFMCLKFEDNTPAGTYLEVTKL